MYTIWYEVIFADFQPEITKVRFEIKYFSLKEMEDNIYINSCLLILYYMNKKSIFSDFKNIFSQYVFLT